MFTSRDQAQAWLDAGATYEKKGFHDVDGVYFDSGTGGIGRVRIRVTDKNGTDLIENVEVSPDATNNYGELLACKYALEHALKSGIKNVFGDSELVIKHWSRGRIKINEPQTVSLSQEVKALREEFESLGGKIERISGDVNPADIGFHR
jgi:ribonuclease HI